MIIQAQMVTRDPLVIFTLSFTGANDGKDESVLIPCKVMMIIKLS